MHPFLENLSLYTLRELISDESKCIKLLTDLKVLPDPASPPSCPSCHHPLFVNSDPNRKLGFLFRCLNKGCLKRFSATKDTFLEELKISIPDILFLIVTWIKMMANKEAFKEINAYRKSINKKSLSNKTVTEYFKRFRQAVTNFGSNKMTPIGGKGKTVEVDETFLTKWKYHRGRKTKQTAWVIFGLYCRDDKTGYFFQVPSKSKKYLWPLMKKYIHPDTAVICSDEGKQYHSLPLLFPESNIIHKTVNHSLRFRDEEDKNNHINSIESQNKYLKKRLISRKTPESVKGYMFEYWYRRTFLAGHELSEQVEIFLTHVSETYPGLGKEKLKMREQELPTAEEMGITHLMPKERPKKEKNEKEEDEEYETDELGTLIEGEEWCVIDNDFSHDDYDDDVGLISGMI
jgi:hypothetical protein